MRSEDRIQKRFDSLVKEMGEKSFEDVALTWTDGYISALEWVLKEQMEEDPK